MIERITILDFHDEPPSVVAHVWYSQERGLTCDSAWLRETLQKTGPAVPRADGTTRTLSPADGRQFFLALPLLFTGLERAGAPEIVAEQGGEGWE